MKIYTIEINYWLIFMSSYGRVPKWIVNELQFQKQTIKSFSEDLMSNDINILKYNIFCFNFKCVIQINWKDIFWCENSNKYLPVFNSLGCHAINRSRMTVSCLVIITVIYWHNIMASLWLIYKYELNFPKFFIIYNRRCLLHYFF